MSDCIVTCREARLQVAGELTIYSAADVKQRIFELAAECGSNIELDLSNVTALDTAGVQILLMLRRLAHSKGATFRLLQPSAAAVEVLELCGLQALVTQPAAMERTA